VLAFSPKLLGSIMSSREVWQASVDYLNYRVWGILFAFTNVAFRAYFVGTTKTGLLGWSAGIMAFVNILLDYGLIFGNFGLPEMGIEGAALASVIAEFISCIFFIVASLMNESRKKYLIFSFPKFDFQIVSRVWNLSAFIMLQHFASLGGWFTFFLMIEQTGEKPLAISNIIRSLYLLIMIHIWSFNASVTSLVSNAIGEANREAVFPIIDKFNKLSSLISILIIGATVFIPELLIKIYTTDPGLIDGTIPVFYVVIFAILPMAVSINWFGAVSGTANTKTALGIEIITMAIYLTYVFTAVFIFRASLTVIWLSEYVYIITIGTLSYLYMKYGNWRDKVV
jgi:Na+-driven multidrug efflux pump